MVKSFHICGQVLFHPETACRQPFTKFCWVGDWHSGLATPLPVPAISNRACGFPAGKFTLSTVSTRKQVRNNPQPRRNPHGNVTSRSHCGVSRKSLNNKGGAKGGIRTPTPCGTRS